MSLKYVFMDESGTHQESVALAVAGYVFSPADADNFSISWGRKLREFGLPHAHMTDCANGFGHYRDMSKEERVNVQNCLIRAIHDHAEFGCSTSLAYHRYRQLFGGSRFDHDAYTTALAMNVVSVNKWAESNGMRDKFVFVFEAGHAAQSEADRVMAAIVNSPFGARYESHEFKDKSEAMPLQAADMLAWHAAHHIKRREEGHPNKRKDFVALLRDFDFLLELAPHHVDIWRRMMEDLDREIVEKVRSKFSDDPDGAARYAREILGLNDRD